MAGGVYSMLWSEAATVTVQVPDWCYAAVVCHCCVQVEYAVSWWYSCAVLWWYSCAVLQPCYVMVVLLWAAVLTVLVYARGIYALSKCTNACTEKKVSVIQICCMSAIYGGSCTA